MRIATWNINGLRARLDYLKLWLEERQPDLIGLQELKLSEDKFPYEDLLEVGYHAQAHGQKAWNGVAVLSKKKVEVIQKGLPGQDDFGSRMIHVKTDNLSFITIYAPNGKNLSHADYAKKLEWYDELTNYLKNAQFSASPSILCGDFNICPTPLDTWDEERLAGAIFHTTAARDRISKLNACGLNDIFREFNPSSKDFSWWDYRGGAFYKNHGLRIDFLYGSPDILSSVNTSTIDRDYRKKKEGLTASDHAPVIADIE